MSLVKEFREFILRGNVVDLAVGVVIGASFGAVVKQFTTDVITPLIGMGGKSNLGDIVFTVHGAKFPVGDLLNAIISFLLTAFVVFFFVVKPVNVLMSMKKTEPPAEETTQECPRCLSKIPIKATRCAFCTSDLPATA